jgi:diguanylate cyclase (GGDEF)-like protein
VIVPKFDLLQIFNTINLGLIVVDMSGNVLLWNDWVVKHSRIPATEALGKKISHAFSEVPSSSFLTALKNTLTYRLPTVLSNALHQTPLPLFDPAELEDANRRMYQSITLSPISSAHGAPCCLIQITNANASIKREKILRTHSEMLKLEATTDSLTGIYNRRFFEEHVKMAFAHCKRQQFPLSVFMLDIDFFKQYNDYYGHLAGDKALTRVATTLQTQLSRATDIVARFGGEEFVMVLPNMSEENAIQFAEKMLHAVWDMNLPHLRSPIADRLTVSIGLCIYDANIDGDVNTILTTADSALYQAKLNGRNKYVCLPFGTNR